MRTLTESLAVSLVGGIIFYLLHVPLAWMLGPIAFVMIWKLYTKRTLSWPIQLRDIGLMVLGSILGTSFTMDTIKQIIHQLPSMLIVTILTILFSFLMGYMVSKASNINLVSGIIGSVPGGLSQMIVLGEELQGVDPTVVTFMQTFRLLAVIFIVPFLVAKEVTGVGVSHTPLQAAITSSVPFSVYILFILVVIIGAKIGKKIALPTAPLLGPLIGTAILMLSGVGVPKVPSLIVIIAQLFVGTYMGLKMDPTSLSDWKRLAPLTTGASVLLVMFSLGLGWLLTLLYPISLVSAFLGTSPGGIAEMGVTAHDVHADLSMVTAYQMFRVFFILFAVPPCLKWGIKRLQRNYKTEPIDKSC